MKTNSFSSPFNPVGRPYELGVGLESRSISFENPTGGRGAGGQAARPETGIGRKGRPSIVIVPGESVSLAEIEGPGTIRHIWMATRPTPEKLRGIMIRGYWINDIRVTIQQLGIENGILFERQDDWCCSSFWYEPIPSGPLPILPDITDRLADLWR